MVIIRPQHVVFRSLEVDDGRDKRARSGTATPEPWVTWLGKWAVHGSFERWFNVGLMEV